MESIDKLRKLPYHGTNGFGSCVTASKETINQIADEIEAEIADRYMPNPLDADGVPIRTGDIIEFGKKGERLEVTHIGWTKHGEPTIAYRRPNGTLDCSCIGTECRHVKPRTVEDVLREFVNHVVTFKGSRDGIPIVGIDDSLWRDYYAECADELRELLGVMRNERVQAD